MPIHQLQNIIKRKDVEKVTTLSRSSIYRKMQEGTFPRPIRLGGSSIGWRADDIQQWIDERAQEAGLPTSNDAA